MHTLYLPADADAGTEQLARALSHVGFNNGQVVTLRDGDGHPLRLRVLQVEGRRLEQLTKLLDQLGGWD
jgi:hypothetical protein